MGRVEDILLGYNMLHQCHFASWGGMLLKLPDDETICTDPRCRGIMDGLSKVSQELPWRSGDTPWDRTMWTHSVGYSNQAWADLNEIGERYDRRND